MITKKAKSIFFVVLMGVLTLVSCNKEDDPKDTTQNQIETNVQEGSWKVTKFVDSGVDETGNFSGYTFTFGASGVLTATNGSTTYEGTWSITDSNSDDDSQDDLDFNINFDQTNDFQDLNDDWDFVSQSASKIELIDVSGGNGDTDYLTFEIN